MRRNLLDFYLAQLKRVFKNARCGYTNTKHILVRWQILLGLDPLQRVHKVLRGVADLIFVASPVAFLTKCTWLRHEANIN